MEIAVQGWRSSPAEWDAAHSISPAELPPLTEEQREVTRKLGIPEEDYARSVLAGRRTQERLLQRAQAIAAFLGKRIERDHLPVELRRVVLDVVEHRFTVELQTEAGPRILRISEEMVDDFLDSGSAEAEAALTRIVDRALLGVTA